MLRTRKKANIAEDFASFLLSVAEILRTLSWNHQKSHTICRGNQLNIFFRSAVKLIVCPLTNISKDSLLFQNKYAQHINK